MKEYREPDEIIKEQGKVIGYGWKSPCPDWLRKKIIQQVGKCQIATCNETQNLEINRIKRGNQGGLYTLIKPHNHKKQNCQVLCSKHHKEIHSAEKGTKEK